jgi:hypothetical protein
VALLYLIVGARTRRSRVNSSNVDFESEGITLNADSKVGFVGGLTFNHAASDMFGVEADAVVSMKGTKFDFGGGEKGTMTLTYLDIPVLARINIPAGTNRVHRLLGPSFNFKLHESFDHDEDDEGDSGIKAFETALVFGGGVTANRFRIDARYGLGLTSFTDEDEEEFTAKNKVFTVLVGVELR